MLQSYPTDAKAVSGSAQGPHALMRQPRAHHERQRGRGGACSPARHRRVHHGGGRDRAAWHWRRSPAQLRLRHLRRYLHPGSRTLSSGMPLRYLVIASAESSVTFKRFGRCRRMKTLRNSRSAKPSQGHCVCAYQQVHRLPRNCILETQHSGVQPCPGWVHTSRAASGSMVEESTSSAACRPGCPKRGTAVTHPRQAFNTYSLGGGNGYIPPSVERMPLLPQ